LLTTENIKLERLKLPILFTIIDVRWVKAKIQMHVTRGYTKNLEQNFHSPLFFRSPLQKFHSPWSEPFTRLRSTVLHHQNQANRGHYSSVVLGQ